MFFLLSRDYFSFYNRFQRYNTDRLIVEWTTCFFILFSFFFFFCFHLRRQTDKGKINGRRDRACLKTLEKKLKPIEVSASSGTSSSSSLFVSAVEHKRSHCFSSSRCHRTFFSHLSPPARSEKTYGFIARRARTRSRRNGITDESFRSWTSP